MPSSHIAIRTATLMRPGDVLAGTEEELVSYVSNLLRNHPSEVWTIYKPAYTLSHVDITLKKDI